MIFKMRRNFNINKVNDKFHNLSLKKRKALNKVALQLFEMKSIKQQRQTTPEALLMVIENI